MVKNLPANVGDLGSICGSGRCPGVGNGNPLQSSCLEYSMNKGAWWAIAHGVSKSQTRLSARACAHTHTHTQEEQRKRKKLVIVNERNKFPLP